MRRYRRRPDVLQKRKLRFLQDEHANCPARHPARKAELSGACRGGPVEALSVRDGVRSVWPIGVVARGAGGGQPARKAVLVAGLESLNGGEDEGGYVEQVGVPGYVASRCGC